MPRKRDDRNFRPRKNIEAIMDAFARGDKPGPRSSRIYCPGRRTCSTDGDIIYSYNEPIAIKLHDENNTVVVRESWGTATTNSQIRACKICLPRYGFRVQVVPDPGRAVENHKSKRRYSAARPHGRCVHAGYCVEHEANPDVPSCGGRSDV